MAPSQINLTDYIDNYDVARELAVDRSQHCIILDVGTDEHRLPVKSLRHIRREIFEYICPDPKCRSANKLYIIGRWNFSFDLEEELEQALDKERTVSLEEDEWSEGGSMICDLIRALPNLTELTWITIDFPFTEAVWPALPTGLKKLVLDIGQPVKVHPADSDRQTYISRKAMGPLTGYNDLEELRLFNMQDTFQSIIWETVFRATTAHKIMKVVDLQMAMKPVVRTGCNWIDMGRVDQTHSICQTRIGVYRGQDGRGTIRHSWGQGEYLDYKAIRQARLDRSSDAKKAVFLLCLKLDGFVVDHHPFAGYSDYDNPELGSLALLVCGPKCFDAGICAPRTSSPSKAWDHMLGNATTTHCMIKLPKWTGIFDADGRQLHSESKALDNDKKENQTVQGKSDAIHDLKKLAELLKLVDPEVAAHQLSKLANESDMSFGIPDSDTGTLVPSTPLSASSNVSVHAPPVRVFGPSLSSTATPSARARRKVTFADTVTTGPHDSILHNVPSASTSGDIEDPRPSAAGSTSSNTPEDKDDDLDDWEFVDPNVF